MKSAHDMEHGSMDHDSMKPGHRGHSWMMMACCVPMLVIAIALVATHTVSVGFLFVALACTAMMAMMMRGMKGMGGGDKPM